MGLIHFKVLPVVRFGSLICMADEKNFVCSFTILLKQWTVLNCNSSLLVMVKSANSMICHNSFGNKILALYLLKISNLMFSFRQTKLPDFMVFLYISSLYTEYFVNPWWKMQRSKKALVVGLIYPKENPYNLCTYLKMYRKLCSMEVQICKSF